MSATHTTLLALALLAASPAATAQGLDCPEEVCWEARLTLADGAGFPGEAAPTVALGEILILTVDGGYIGIPANDSPCQIPFN